MTAKAFRILHYAPDPASGARFPVAALTVSDSGVEVFLSPHVPADSWLGGTGRARFFQRLQQRLMKARDFNAIPGLGPYCELSDPVVLQPGAGADFVRQLVAGWQPQVRRATVGARISRGVEGYRWLSGQCVGQFVKRKFSPTADCGAFLNHAPALEAISQYVPGVESLVLLEPLTLRPRIEDDIHKLALRFGAYSTALHSRPAASEGPHVDMYLYVLPGVSVQYVERARRDIAYSSATVIDVADLAQRATLLDRIHAVAAESSLVH